MPLEEQAWGQLRNVASLPFIHKHIATMHTQTGLVDVVHTLKQVVCVKG